MTLTDHPNLRSSLFRLFLAEESESQWEVPLPLIFLLPLSHCRGATPTCLKGNRKDCNAGQDHHYDKPVFVDSLSLK